MDRWLAFIFVALLSACGGSSNSSSSNAANDSDTNGEMTSSPGGGGNAAVPGSPSSFGVPVANQIRPGVEISADGSGCTGNFLFSPNAQTVYIGVAAHCFSEDTNSGVDACETNNLPIGFNQVVIENATQAGEIVYSSWRAMQESGETPGSNACVYNDFALVKIHPDDLANIHPAGFAFGGPVSLRTGLAAVGDDVFAYGRSPFHFGQRNLEAKSGTITGVSGDGWAYQIQTDNPGVPGDSGGPIYGPNGEALAVLSVLSAGVGGLSVINVSNGVTNLDRALRYAIDGGFINANTKVLLWPDFYPAGDF
ncbi:trypsin-like peptidase domain-containing protein [Zhongshania arctica]|uniref:Trypsin-like peptidase domain-containing protein n=1 Tax=Zhongshania arctica TaxID=3238302 RepID=A0ABV3TT79_9GAMM